MATERKCPSCSAWNKYEDYCVERSFPRILLKKTAKKNAKSDVEVFRQVNLIYFLNVGETLGFFRFAFCTKLYTIQVLASSLSHPFLRVSSMAKWRAHIAFVSLMILYFIVRILRSQFPELQNFIRFQLNDLFFVPTMCLFALNVLRTLQRDATLTISWAAVAIQVILVSIYFEVCLPNNEPEGHRQIGDWLDFLMYMLGGIAFVIFQPFTISKAKKRNPFKGFRRVKR